MYIFCFSTIRWDYLWQRPQQLMRALGDLGHTVFFVGFDYQKRKPGIMPTEHKNVFVVSFPFPPYVREYGLLENGNRPEICCEYLLQYLQGKPKEKILLWSHACWATDFVLMLKRHLQEINRSVLFAYDILDLQEDFYSSDAELVDSLRRFFAQSVRQADILFYTSELFKATFPATKKSRHLPNACVPEQWDWRERAYGPGPIGYFGAISSWFDFDVLKELDSQDREIRLYGPTRKAISNKDLSLFELMLKGEIEHTKLPGVVRDWRCGLIPFKKSRLTDHVNPIKLYEYTAAGLPVVATNLKEMRLLSEEMPEGIRPFLAEDIEDWPALIDQAIGEDSKEKVEMRAAWAQQHSWLERAKRIVEECAL